MHAEQRDSQEVEERALPMSQKSSLYKCVCHHSSSNSCCGDLRLNHIDCLHHKSTNPWSTFAVSVKKQTNIATIKPINHQPIDPLTTDPLTHWPTDHWPLIHWPADHWEVLEFCQHSRKMTDTQPRRQSWYLHSSYQPVGRYDFSKPLSPKIFTLQLITSKITVIK